MLYRHRNRNSSHSARIFVILFSCANTIALIPCTRMLSRGQYVDELYSQKNTIDFNSLVPHNMEWQGGLNDISNLVLFEDKNVMVVFKPPTILSQSDKDGTSDNLFDACKRYVAAKRENCDMGLVHRIDRPCSGLMVFAKTSESTSALCEQFKKGSTDKNYLCVVNGFANETRICVDKILKTSTDKTKIFPINSTRPDVVNAKLRFKSLKVMEKPNQQQSVGSVSSAHETLSTDSSDSPTVVSNSTAQFQSLLQVELETGRKHQIRAQLAHIGHPIVGDVKYGAPQSFRHRDICLHAFSLTFRHPVSNKQLRFRADVPRVWGARFGPDILEETRKIVTK